MPFEKEERTELRPYDPPTLTVLGTLAELTKTGTATGKEHGGNGRKPITMSNL
jgi:hypothetical protein